MQSLQERRYSISEN